MADINIDVSDVNGLEEKLDRIERKQRWIAEVISKGQQAVAQCLQEEIDAFIQPDCTVVFDGPKTLVVTIVGPQMPNRYGRIFSTAEKRECAERVRYALGRGWFFTPTMLSAHVEIVVRADAAL